MDRAPDLSAASPAVVGRRSWFEGPRLWPVAVALVCVAVTAQIATSASAGRPLLDHLPFALLVACGGFGGAALRTRWSRREWGCLRDDALADGQEPLAAEAVVRDGVEPTDDDQRQLALRIGELWWRDSGGWTQGPLLAALATVVLAVLAVDSSPWWWPLSAVSAVVAVLLGRSASQRARRRAELEALR